MRILRRWLGRFSCKTIPHSFGDLADFDPAERILCWPEERTAWIEENLSNDELSAANVLEAVRKRAARASYTARDTENGTLITGPVSSILLQDEEKVTEFVAFMRLHEQ